MGEFDRKPDERSTSVEPAQFKATVGKRSRVTARYGGPMQLKAAAGSATADQAGGGSGRLPESVQAKMEQSFATDFSGVRIHEDEQAASMGARAFTQGTDIHFAPGEYDPFGHGGQELIGHELAHVVQQSQGRVQATTQAKGTALNDDAALEQEADELGARAARGEAVGQRFGEIAGGTSIVQRKREPISPAGLGLINLAKNYFRNLKRASIKKSHTDMSAKAITESAGKIDVGAEKNQDFLALVKIFKLGLHASDAEAIRTNVEEKFVALTGEIVAEGEQQKEAEAVEIAEGGHALARHGPTVSDAALTRRLYTGIAPDDALCPAPGASSRFNSHTDVLATRQAGASTLQAEIAAAAGYVLAWLPSIPGLANVHANAQVAADASTAALGTAKDAKTEGFAKKLPDKNDRLAAFQKAGKDEQIAKAAAATALDEKDNPGKNLKRILPSQTKLKLAIQDDAGPGDLMDGVKLVESYTVVVDHGRPIGSGYQSSDADAIKLKDVLAQVANDPGSNAPTPKSNGDIVAALTALHVGGNIAEFAAYLSDATNLATVKKKADSGAKIYTAASAAGDLTKSYTNFKRGGDGTIFDAGDNFVPVDTAGWDTFQHFPALSSAVDGVQD